MDYTSLLRNAGDKKSRVGIIGATKGYGYTLLAQIPKVKLMELRLISSRHTDECEKVLIELGWPKEKLAVCSTKEEIQAAPKDAVLIVGDYRLVPESDITALVECTGNSKVSSEVSMAALKKGINVYMCSKETDSVCGTMLNQIAPRNLVDLWSWGKLLGFEIIAAGKASEYDFVWNPDSGELTFTEGPDYPHESLHELKEFWNYKDRSTLEGRRKLLEKYMNVISADLCEMNLVSNITGLVPAAKRLSYPVAKASELADIFIPEEDGGVLKKTGVPPCERRSELRRRRVHHRQVRERSRLGSSRGQRARRQPQQEVRLPLPALPHHGRRDPGFDSPRRLPPRLR